MPPRSWLLIFVFVCTVCVTPPCGATTYLSINDNQSAPYFGVTKGGPVRPNTDEFAVWLNRSTIIGGTTLSFGTGSDWNSLASYWDWFYPPASNWILEGQGRLLAVSVPMLPGPTDDSGPTSGPGAGSPVSLAQGATGKYNSYFYSLAQNLVANNLGSSIIRLGWEFNGNWYAWSVATSADATNFAAYWKQIVNTMRTVPGQNFKFNWGGSITWEGTPAPYKLSDAFPVGNDASGKPYVDQVGLDIYDNSWSYYPWAAGSTAAQILAVQQYVWANVINSPSNYWGIPVWTAIAKANNVPFTIPEWGVSTDIHAGQDNTYYIQQMYDFIQNPANNVYSASYYDAEIEQISPNDGYVTSLVNSAALYRQLFTILPAAPSGVTATGGNGTVTLSWTTSTGAASYTILRAMATGGPYSPVATGVSALTYTDSSVNNLVTYYYVVAPVNAGGQGANSAQASATPAVPPASFNAWAATTFTPTQLATPAISGPQADPAGDGITNLMKYALGLNPNVATVVNLSPQMIGQHLTLTYRRLTNPTDIQYVPQVSSDLVNWVAMTPVVTVPDTGTGMETVQATDPVTMLSALQRFARLQVTSP